MPPGSYFLPTLAPSVLFAQARPIRWRCAHPAWNPASTLSRAGSPNLLTLTLGHTACTSQRISPVFLGLFDSIVDWRTLVMTTRRQNSAGGDGSCRACLRGGPGSHARPTTIVWGIRRRPKSGGPCRAGPATAFYPFTAPSMIPADDAFAEEGEDDQHRDGTDRGAGQAEHLVVDVAAGQGGQDDLDRAALITSGAINACTVCSQFSSTVIRERDDAPVGPGPSWWRR